MEFLSNVPWAYVAVGYLGWAVYLLLSLGNPKDQALSSFDDLLFSKGRIVIASFLVTPVLVAIAKQYGQLNVLSAFCGGYVNVNVLRKLSETYLTKSKVLGN